MTTVMLNKVSKIHGHVIRKNYGKIGFKTIKSAVKVSKTEKTFSSDRKSSQSSDYCVESNKDRLEL